MGSASSFQPIDQTQAGDAIELTDIVADESQVVLAGNRRNHQVVWSDESTLAREVFADHGVELRRDIVEGKAFHGLEEAFQQLEVLVHPCAVSRAIDELGLDDAAQFDRTGGPAEQLLPRPR